MKQNKPLSEKCAIGTIYQLKPAGNFYFRFQLDGHRSCRCLKTKDIHEARVQVQKLIPTLHASTIDAIETQAKLVRDMDNANRRILLADAWKEYSIHPERATPATKAEELSYEATWRDFVEYVGRSVMFLCEVNYDHARQYAEHLRTLGIAVDTHNRRLRRIRKIFDVLHDYRYNSPNPFLPKNLYRLQREEQDMGVRRIAFTQEQEAKLLEVLSDDRYQVMNKKELRIIFIVGMYTGQRLKDCVLLRWNKIDLVQHRIHVVQFKTGKYVSIPIAKPLWDALGEAQGWKQSDIAYVCPNVATRYNLVAPTGKNYGNNLVDLDVLRVIRWIGVENSIKVPGRKKAVTVYGFHSLRHSFASHCAEAGVPRAVVTSILGADDEVVGQYYTHIGNAAQREAVDAIVGSVSELPPLVRLNNALDYLHNVPADLSIEVLKSELTAIMTGT